MVSPTKSCPDASAARMVFFFRDLFWLQIWHRPPHPSQVSAMTSASGKVAKKSQALTACKVNCRVVGMQKFNTFNNVIVTRQHSALNRQLTLHADVSGNF
jgi:hypothetical protein